MAETTETGTDLLAPDVLTPESLFNAADGAVKGAQLIERITQLATDFKPDLSTPKGRGEISSLAFRITRTKTAIDAAGKKVNEAARAQINAVDAQRRDYWAKLEELAKTVRKPLTDWEAAEETRVNAAKALVEELQKLGIVLAGTTSQEVARRVLHLRALELPDEAVLQEYFQQATAAKAESLKALATAHKALLKDEADKAELDKLRKEAADRKAADDAKAAEEAAAAEAKRKAEEEAAAETARLDAAAAAEQRGRDAAAAEAAEAERKRLADEAERAADKAHRDGVIAAAALAILNIVPVSGKKSVELAEAIADGKVPHVKMEF